MSMKHKHGDYVQNPNKLEWGPGIVLDVAGDIVTVYFRDSTDKPVRNIMTNIVDLVSADINSDSVLDNLPPYDKEEHKLSRRRVTHKDGIEKFRSYYPLLFDDPTYLADFNEGERGYKVAAHESFHKELGQGVGRKFLENGDYLELSKRLFVVEGQLNLLSPYESMALKDALKNENAALAYFSALFDVCDQDKVTKDTYQVLINAVDNLPADEGRARVSTWPVLTQFPFIARPDCHMFLKPTVTQSCADRMVFDLQYQPSLNWITYSKLIQLADRLFEELKPMGARDYIDVQSYIWVIGAY